MPLPRAALPGGDDRPAGQRPLGPPDSTPRRTTTWSYIADTIAVMDAPRRRAGRPGRASASAAWQALLTRSAAPGPGAGRGGHRAVRTGQHAADPGAGRRPPSASTSERADVRAAGRSSTATTGCGTGPDFADFFFGELCREPHSTQGASRTSSPTPGTPPGEIMVAEHRARAVRRDASSEAERLLRDDPLPRRSSCTAPRTAASR